MKKSIPRIGIVLIAVFIGSLGCPVRAVATNTNVMKASQSQSERTVLPEDFGLSQKSPRSLSAGLDRYGHLRSGSRGPESFEARGYRMIAEKGKAPRFVPAEAEDDPAEPNAAGDKNWDDRFFLGGGTDGSICTVVTVGSDVYIGGHFSSAGGVNAYNIAKWDGTKWSALGSGMRGFQYASAAYVYTIAVSGKNVYAGGWFDMAGGKAAHHIAKWDGTKWSALGGGTDDTVYALAVSGKTVYAAGRFHTAGGVAANHIAKWNGVKWSPLGNGLGGGEVEDVHYVKALAISGNEVYAGGAFDTAGDGPADNIAKWNGKIWSALGRGLGHVFALAVSGSNVYVGGGFFHAGELEVGSIVKWDGTTWSALGSGLSGKSGRCVYSLAVSEKNIIVGGVFDTAGGVAAQNIAKWDGSCWSTLGSGTNDLINAVAVSDRGVYAGGEFTTAGGAVANYISEWNGTNWSHLGIFGKGVNNGIFCEAVSGSHLYVAGQFSAVGGISANNIAKWDGESWTTLGSGIKGKVYALAVIGNDLYAGGYFSEAGGVSAKNIAKWNGMSWDTVGGGVDGPVKALAVSGNSLYVGGFFNSAGGVWVYGVAIWDGTKWSALGGVSGWVSALAVSGNNLYVGGIFQKAGGVIVNNIAKWDGADWTALGGGVHGYGAVKALAILGDDLYAGGEFEDIGGITANRIAKWDGTKWSALSGGIRSWRPVNALAVSGEDLFVGGAFNKVGGKRINRIAKWNGKNWSALGNGIDNGYLGSDDGYSVVYALAILGTDIYVGGLFAWAGKNPSFCFARWMGSKDDEEQDDFVEFANDADFNNTESERRDGADAPPFGEFETPADGAAIDASTVDVSGWAMDDIGIKSVKIYRQTGAGGRALIGTAKLIVGARPDIKTNYPGYPGSNRAGWSYTLRMNKLPNKGRGNFTLLAYATDVSGKETLLGSHTITGLMVSEDESVSFGALDLPKYYGTATGSAYPIFRWGPWPPPAAVSADGSEFTVWVDGMAAGHPIGRANRRNGATEFLHMPGKTTRAGTFLLDTTNYADGWHTIAWSAAEAIGAVGERGSAYFRIQNETQENTLSGGEEESGSGASPIIENAFSQRTPISLNGFFPEDRMSPVYVKCGFNDSQIAEAIYPEEDGLIRIRIPQASRLEIHLNRDTAIESETERYRAYASVETELRSLPIGASFDAKDGILFWQPGPGFLGDHYFVLIDSLSGTRKTVRITIF